jgi:hypothetical protein
MTMRNAYIMTTGPFPYDDTDTPYGFKTDGQMYAGVAPVNVNEVVRICDLTAWTKSYGVAFGAVTSVTILGATHKLGKTDISVSIWDASSPRALIEADAITIDSTTFDVVITFAQSQSGRIVLIG